MQLIGYSFSVGQKGVSTTIPCCAVVGLIHAPPSRPTTLVLLLSTPNAHASPSVRKFKSRALKRHEKFNNMLKVFGCLSIKNRHTEVKFKICFEAVAVVCHYQLENGSPLWNIYVGDM